MRKFHPPCKDLNCALCLQDVIKLFWYLEELTGLNESEYCLNVLDDYQWWMRQNGIDHLTDNSDWGKDIIYLDENINKYVIWFKSTLNDRIEKQIEKDGKIKSIPLPTLNSIKKF